ncbi:hypothetical protein GGI16_002643 [Coemansia sp. S142-1]|nr:hypothetical protein GGI16_002643 [Coemansia sp. S142-1]
MIFTDGVGVSISTFRWVRKNRRKQTSEDSATPSGMSIAEQKSMTSYSYNRRAKRKRESSPTAPLSSARSPVVSLTSVPITYPTTVPLPSEPSIVLPSRAGVKRKHTPEPTSNTGDEHIAVSVPSTAPVLTPGPEPPPPVSMTEPESMPIGQPNDQVVYTRKEIKAADVRLRAEIDANPYDGLLLASASQETIEATLAAAAADDDLADRIAALDESMAIGNAYLSKCEAAARRAGTFDFAEYYAQDKRTAIYDKEREAVTIEYEMAIKSAEARAGPEETRTQAQTAALEAARTEAMKTTERGLHVARSIASDVVDTEQRKKAAALAAIRDLNHVHIGGDPGVRTYATFSRIDKIWVCSFSAKQYHADSGSTWRAAEMSRLIDRFNLRQWMSRIPSSKTASSEKTLKMLRYLFATDAFNRYLQMHQLIRVRIMRWRKYEQQQSTIASYCNKVTAGCTRENTTINMGNAELHNMRGCLPCPRVKKLTDYWGRTGWRVNIIKENNTSQVCSTCMMRLPDSQAPVRLCTLGDEHTRLRYKVRPSNNHFVRHCSVCGTTWNRDVNAARNMAYLGYLLALGLPRPWFFDQHLEDPPEYYEALFRPLVSRKSLLSDDQGPFPACKPAPVYRYPTVHKAVLLSDKAPLPACTPAHRPHRVRHYAHITQPTPRPAREPSLRFEHPLPRRLLPRDDQGPYPACARRDPRPPKPQEKRPRWMPTAVRAGQLRQANADRSADRSRHVDNSDVSRLTEQFAHLNLTDKPGSSALRRMAVNEKRTVCARAVIAALYESASG